MQLTDFDYDLPAELIARYPLEKRSASRLLCLNPKTQTLQHRHFTDLISELERGDLLVFNNTRVIPARLYGQKASGGQIEVLVERILSDHHLLAHIKASKAPKAGSLLNLAGAFQAQVSGRVGDLFKLEVLDSRPVLTLLEQYGSVPLPPYLARAAESDDAERYQTVYATVPGAVAAPTAGLHFDTVLLQQLRQRGVDSAFVTLHVGAGTFQPVRVNNILEHTMHAEYMELSAAVCEQIAQTKARGKRVIAVGTTAVRCLEGAVDTSGKLQAYVGDTCLFIYPGFKFQVVDALLTNFHLPQSTLLMLVSAFAGYEFTLQAYQEAVKQRYRFFSYGDAMWVNTRAI